MVNCQRLWIYKNRSRNSALEHLKVVIQTGGGYVYVCCLLHLTTVQCRRKFYRKYSECGSDQFPFVPQKNIG
ncbi:unnamed protein product [Hermetia illucens]|uniref:Uncharacterized protein n=1 Tax=Hermetia illucens TaxID=343691 RepID=A0A7R8UWC2_HERIL|nr:unnamed protein product [Hermetia illucens]